MYYIIKKYLIINVLSQKLVRKTIPNIKIYSGVYNNIQLNLSITESLGTNNNFH
jgi:hypothetical protein